MKTTDFTGPVMQKIAGYEKKKSTEWLTSFRGIVLAFLLIIIVAAVLIVKSMMDFQLFDMFNLFSEDREIIVQFWQDTLVTFWEELPQQTVLIMAVTLVIAAGMLFFTRSKRKLIKKKLSEVAKYMQKR